MKYLLLKPGFLPKEYMSGRRVSYLNPIRMYIFTSAFFFLIFFAFLNLTDAFRSGGSNALTKTERDSLLAKTERKIIERGSTEKLEKLKVLLNDTSREVNKDDISRLNGNFRIMGIGDRKYTSLHEYDSIQQQLPASEKDGWFTRMWAKKELEINEKYKNDPSSSLEKFTDIFLHKLPYLLFLSLPFFALILKLLYIRHEWYYAEHVIFTVYHYIFSFLLLLFIFGFDALSDWTGWGVFDLMIGLSFFAWAFYLYKSMRRFYGQRRFKTVIKFLLLNILAFVCIVFLLIFFVMFSVFQL